MKKYLPYLLILFVFICYLFTIAPSVVEIDSGELAAVQATAGIAHPTGYPLFTMIGYLFLKLPLPFTKIFSANLLAALWCVLGIFMFYKIVSFLFENISQPVEPETINKKKTTKKNSPVKKQIAFTAEARFASILLACLMLAFDKTYWAQSTSVEVYSLQIFLFTVIIYFLLRAFYTKEKSTKSWLIAATALALGFSNHMTTLLILPGFAYLFFTKEKFSKQAFIKIGLMLALFFPLLALIYMYLPIRASQNPAINWGNPINFENFFRHFTGKQYQVWLFSSTDAAKKQLEYFVTNLPSEFGIPGLIIIATGFYALFKYSKEMFYFALVVFLSTMLYSINYDIKDIDSYFLLAYISLALFSVFGFAFIFTRLRERKINLYACIVILLLPSLFELYSNYKDNDQSGNYAFEDYTKAIIASTEKNSILFTYQWDYLVSPSYYFQQVEGYRKDAVVIDKELLRRSWYYNQIRTDHPGVLSKLNEPVNHFLDAVKPFEQGSDYDSGLLEKYYRQIMTGLIYENIDKRNFYIAPELYQNEMQRGEFSLPTGYNIVPGLFFFKVVKGNDYVPAPDPDYTIRLPEFKNKYIDFITNMSATMLAYRALYELQFNKPDRAKVYVRKIRKDFKDFRLPGQLVSLE